MDSLDRIIQETQGLLQRLIASKTALQLEQQTPQTLPQTNLGTSPPAVASLSTPQNHVRVALRDLTSVAQEAVLFSTSHLSLLDDGPTTSFTAGTAATPLTQRTPLPPSPPGHALDHRQATPAPATPQPDSHALRPNTPSSIESLVEGRDATESNGPGVTTSAKRQCEGGNGPGQATKKPKTSGSASSKGDSHSAELEKLILKLKSNDQLCRIPSFPATNPPTATMLQRVAAVQSGPAIRQFCSLVAARRDRTTDMGLFQTQSQGVERAMELWRSLRLITDKSTLNSFMSRLVQYQMALAVDNTKQGRIRADPAEINKMMDKFGFSASDRTKFQHQVTQGRFWRLVCGRFPGLLCLIPFKSAKPYCLSGRDYLSMRGGELEIFAQLVHTPFVERICQACEALIDIVLGVKDDMMFKWEKEHPALVSWEKSLSDDILLSLLQPHEYCEENQYDGDEFPDWAKPSGWLDEWPWKTNPLAIVPTERQCDLCSRSKCQCLYTRLVKRRPRIKSWANLGFGLQAVASHEGEVAYRKGEVMGQICGKIVPNGTYPHNSSWVMDMHRPDIDGEPVVCQICVAGPSNCFLNLNHHCRASARVRPLRVSGHWICGIEAIRDIRHGEQITVNFGRRFLRNQGLRCECEACRETL
ncbi:hypothetical protein N0V84_006848 [Fusarium piperis]|uniref:SET domain-containing protein n=1 Tax=Fusarium piperis TaxID=1435070 RepID=A0A9W9BN69_9HYPO|nr:hypothetical protein N0V84_006848 [Fusarium piperis]